MRVLGLLIAMSFVMYGAAFAQGGSIALFSDVSGADCNLLDTQPGELHIYVLHLFAPEVKASAFSVPIPNCMHGVTWLSDTVPEGITLSVGDSYSGVTIAYGACFSSPLHILTINYMVQGLSRRCCPLSVQPDPNQPPHYAGEILVSDCQGILHPATGVAAIVNSDEGCACMSVPVEHSAWGRLKALYAE